MKRNHTKILSVILTAALIGSLIASPTTAGAAKKLKAVSPKSVTAGKSIKIKTNMKCKFKSSKKKIATVNSKGVVKGKKAGNVKITVTAKKSKQKKILKIAVKKPCIRRKTPTPNVDATQTPQVDVTQSPKPPEEASQTPSVPGKSPNPATELPDIPKTPNPPTLTPDVPVPETPSVTSMPGPTDTETPDVPKTPGPSVTPEPTNTATPSQTKQPVGITAEFEGKIPINRELSNEATAMRMLTEGTITVKLRYDDNTEEHLRPQDLYVTQKIVEENGIKYIDATVEFEKFTTVLKVELVDVPRDVLYPIRINCSYLGTTLQKNQIPDLNDIKTQVIMVDQSVNQISSEEIRIADIKDYYPIDSSKAYAIKIVYDYYFYYNGEKLHACESDIFEIPYE